MCLVGALWFANSTFAEDAAQTAPAAATAPSAPADNQVDRRAAVAANVVFGKDEAAGFWPLYGDYRRHAGTLQDQRARAIAAYAENFRTMTGDMAKAMLEDLLQADESLVKLKRDYLKKFLKVLPETKVTRVFIIDACFDVGANRELMAKVPLAGEAASQ